MSTNNGPQTRNQARQRGASEQLTSNNSHRRVVEEVEDNGNPVPGDGGASSDPPGEPASNASSANTVTVTVEDVQAQLLRARADLAEARASLAEERLAYHVNRGHRREHSDDHYRAERRKKTSRVREPDMEDVTNWSSLNLWIEDCEDYLNENPEDYPTQKSQVTWAASRLGEKRRPQWRIHMRELESQGKEVTWAYFVKHIRGWLKTPVVRTIEGELKLESAKQRATQGVAEFAQYLDKLYDQLEEPISDKEKMRNLRTKCNDKIRHEVQRMGYQYANVTEMKEGFVGIELFLRSIGELSKTGSQSGHADNSGGRGGGNRSSLGRGNNSSGATGDGRNLSATTPNNNSAKTRGNANNRGRGRGDRQNNTPRTEGAPEKVTCWTCGKDGHKANNPDCPKYAEYQEKRNRRENGSGKAKT